jgi:nitrogen fixation/metabolism regulation signal transduction histidine kinase
MSKRQFSLQGKLLLYSLSLTVGAVLLVATLLSNLPFWPGVWVALLIVVLITCFMSGVFSKPLVNVINALIDSTDNIKDHDFSITIASTRQDELGELVDRHNEIGQLLRDERYNINQRELLLDTVLQSTPIAMWLCDDRGTIVYANIEARGLLMDGKRLLGMALAPLLGALDRELARAISARQEGLVSIETEGETETFYLTCRFFTLNGRIHRLHLVRRMTREISRQEVVAWKRVIRVISHELNNSLAPISSLTHSGKIVMNKMTSATTDTDYNQEKLALILQTIGERATHLKEFIEGYATFARLPNPRIKAFDLLAMLARIQAQHSCEVMCETPAVNVRLDQPQFEQVFINLIKNARDSCGTNGTVQVRVTTRADQILIIVADDGPGMSAQVLQQALLPFYSTKQQGTGLGLPLCREIVEAHGGQLSIRNGVDAGLEVVMRVPQGRSE